MRIFRNLIFALSLYTRIPLRLKNADERDTAHSLVFLPFAGAIVGGILYGCFVIMNRTALPVGTRVAVFALIPLLMTGGFHVDGFADCQDAFHSYKSREEKLAILKDPHIGAFAVIRMLMLAAVWTGSLFVLFAAEKPDYLYLHICSLFTVRAGCGVLATLLKKAKREGLLHMEVERINRADIALLILQLAAGCAGMIMICPLAGAVSVLALAAFSVYYGVRCYRAFGGVTGDTSGYYITAGEMTVLLAIAVTATVERFL